MYNFKGKENEDPGWLRPIAVLLTSGIESAFFNGSKLTIFRKFKHGLFFSLFC